MNTARFNNVPTLDSMEKQNNCSCEPFLFSTQRGKIAVHSAVAYPYSASADRQWLTMGSRKTRSDRVLSKRIPTLIFQFGGDAGFAL